MEASITDWIQVVLSAASLIITIAGLFFVAYTLKEQARINEQQFELLLIERTRTAREFKPKLLLSYVSHQSGYAAGFNVPQDRIDYFYQIACSENSAFAVKVAILPVSSNGNEKHEVYAQPYYTIAAGSTWNFAISFNGGVYCLIRLYYQDVDGRKYEDDYELNLRHIYPRQAENCPRY